MGTHIEGNGVLIAEDERLQRAELVRQITAIGPYSISEAATAHEAIRLAVQLRPAIVILDGLLPGMHGFEVARFIRRIDAAYHPRIIMMTGIYKQVRYRNEATLKFGIDAYLIKPATAEALREAMVARGSIAARIDANVLECAPCA